MERKIKPVELTTEEKMVANHSRNFLITFGVFFAITLISFWFNKSASDPTLNIAMMYTFGIFVTTWLTDGYLTGLLFSLASVLSVNFFFTYPFQDLNFGLEGYRVTFAGMLIVGVISSILSTRMKRQEEKIKLQEKELAAAEKEKMRANLLRAISHDLRTPLTGIIGNSDSILENEKTMTDSERTCIVENINKDANWLLNMVENLLTVTRINGETAKVNKTPEVVEEVVAASVFQFRKRFPEAELSVSIPDEVIIADMDAMLIGQVIINILQNAEIHASSKKPLELTVNTDDDNVIFSIKDYGTGIDKARLNTIFDGEDFRGESTSSDKHKGMGIGLSICKTIINAHDGNIIARNHEEGAEFVFTLPINKEEFENDTEILDISN